MNAGADANARSFSGRLLLSELVRAILLMNQSLHCLKFVIDGGYLNQNAKIDLKTTFKTLASTFLLIDKPETTSVILDILASLDN